MRRPPTVTRITRTAAVLSILVLILTAPSSSRPSPVATSTAQLVPAAQVMATGTAPTATPTPASPVHAQILAINDFHGNLEPGRLSISAKTGTSDGPGALPAGGAAYLAAKLIAAKTANPASIVVSAGDLISGSPMLSGYYHDEPTIEAMNQILDVGVVGNHEFDEGSTEFRRMVGGGCHRLDGCQDGDGFAGITFDLLAANVVDRTTGRSILPGYVIKDVGGVKIGFIGTVTPETPNLAPRSGITDLTFLDEAATINRLAPQVRAAGADAVVVLTHSGASKAPGAQGGINSCVGFTGSVIGLAKAVSGQVDAMISAHTHQAYICKIKGVLLTSAASYGRLFTTIKVTLDPATRRLSELSADNSVVSHERAPDPAIAALVSRYQKLISPIADRDVAHLSKTATRNRSTSGESVLGDLIADADLAATSPISKGAAQIALTPLGFIAADLAAGRITYRDVYAAQPFGQRLVTMTLTGRQLDQVLELQLCNPTAPNPNLRVPLGVSSGFTYRFDPDLPCGQRISIRDFRLNGTEVSPDSRIRVTVNSFLAAGENGFTVLTIGSSRVTGGLDRDALAAYLIANPQLTLPRTDRVTLG